MKTTSPVFFEQLAPLAIHIPKSTHFTKFQLNKSKYFSVGCGRMSSCLTCLQGGNDGCTATQEDGTDSVTNDFSRTYLVMVLG